MIKTVIKAENGMVMIFNENGEQIPEYQGPYPLVKESILKDAPPDAVFAYGVNNTDVVPREKW